MKGLVLHITVPAFIALRYSDNFSVALHLASLIISRSMMIAFLLLNLTLALVFPNN